MRKSSDTLNALRFAWLASCLAVLAFMLNAGSNPEKGAVFAYSMLALTLPIGFVAAYLVGLVGLLLEHFSGYVIPYDEAANVATWFLCVGVGYLQWFVLLPWLLGTFRDRNRNNEDSSNSAFESGRAKQRLAA